jgi:hypothetical protein
LPVAKLAPSRFAARPMATRSHQLLLLLVCAIALPGCPAQNSRPCETDAQCDPGQRCRRGACGPICLHDGECGSNQRCRENACVPGPECATAADCAEGFRCEGERCLCSGDAVCAANQSCLEGRCAARPVCRADSDCEPLGRRCELTQGVCLPPCAEATDCAPGTNATVATALYQCFQGGCSRRCLGDATCGSPELLCEAGLCARSDCATLSDCPSGQYCTAAASGRCAGFTPCEGPAQCTGQTECRRFAPEACPPGFDCARAICQERPRCLIDGDCAAPTYCESGHCQPSTLCAAASDCAAGFSCLQQRCVPSVCRGLSDCPVGERCSDGRCSAPPQPSEIDGLLLTPARAVLAVGDSATFTLVAFRLDGSSSALAVGSFRVLEPALASIDSSGRLTALSAGTAHVEASVTGAGVPARTAVVQIYPGPPASGRSVRVLEAATGAPIAGALVRGCDSPADSGACAAPVDATTDAQGLALFPSFAGARAHFSAVSQQQRADGFPRFDRITALFTAAAAVTLPLRENPVHGAAGFNAAISFSSVSSTGPYWIGFSLLSASDPSEVDPASLLGDSFLVRLPVAGVQLPVPASVVIYTSPGFGIPQEVKGRSYGVAQPGRRAGAAFAGRFELAQALALRPGELLGYAGAMDFAWQPPLETPLLPLKIDSADLDGDGRCADASRCPQGSEDLPDYAAFPTLTYSPRRPQRLRTWVRLPGLPASLDSVWVAATQVDPLAGLLPFGLASRLAGVAGPGGLRPVEPVLLHSATPYGGAEVGEAGIWALATGGGGGASARLTRGAALPVEATLPAFLPLAERSRFTAATRTFDPGQPEWSALRGAGATVARLELTGARSRHLVYLPLQGALTSLALPEGPDPATDPAAEGSVVLEVVALLPAAGVGADDLFTLEGPNLLQPSLWLDGYSRFRAR